MTDIITIKGKITQWNFLGGEDTFTVRAKDGSSISFFYDNNMNDVILSPENSKLLNVMKYREDIEIVIKTVKE